MIFGYIEIYRHACMFPTEIGPYKILSDLYTARCAKFPILRVHWKLKKVKDKKKKKTTFNLMYFF